MPLESSAMFRPMRSPTHSQTCAAGLVDLDELAGAGICDEYPVLDGIENGAKPVINSRNGSDDFQFRPSRRTLLRIHHRGHYPVRGVPRR